VAVIYQWTELGLRLRRSARRDKCPNPPNARVIKTDDRTLLAALSDGHIHLGHTGADPYMPQMFLHYGVTTVGDANTVLNRLVAGP
jgi:hypothetical protein